jgi:circadian clock protein KaiC
MRGSDHDRELREYYIDGTGLHVGDPFRSVGGILSGNLVNLASPPGGAPSPLSTGRES